MQQSCGTPAQRWRQGCLRKLSAERPGTYHLCRPPRRPGPTAAALAPPHGARPPCAAAPPGAPTVLDPRPFLTVASTSPGPQGSTSLKSLFPRLTAMCPAVNRLPETTFPNSPSAPPLQAARVPQKPALATRQRPAALDRAQGPHDHLSHDSVPDDGLALSDTSLRPPPTACHPCTACTRTCTQTHTPGLRETSMPCSRAGTESARGRAAGTLPARRADPPGRCPGLSTCKGHTATRRPRGLPSERMKTGKSGDYR